MLLFYYFGVGNYTHGLTYSSCLRVTFAVLKEYDLKKFGEEMVYLAYISWITVHGGKPR